jgi:hypothetical protein
MLIDKKISKTTIYYKIGRKLNYLERTISIKDDALYKVY